MDRISLLPDCLLVEIISRIKIKSKTYHEHERRITTKEVIRTTATISKRWQHLWTLLPNRTFIDEYDLTNNQTDLTHYVSFIDKTLTQCPPDVKLSKFKLYVTFDSDSNPQFKSQAISWIHHAIIHCNLQKVHLRLWDIEGDPCEFIFDDALFFNNTCITSMKLCDCLLNPPNGVISWENLKILRLWRVELDEDMIEIILSGSPCLKSLEFKECYGYRRIDITSKSLMMFTFTRYDCHYVHLYDTDYIDAIEINAPHLLALTIQDKMYLKKLLLRDVSSLIQAKLQYRNLGDFDISRDVPEEEMLKGLLESLSHVNDVTLGGDCLEVLSRLEAKGFHYFEDTDDTSPVRDSV